MDYLPQNITSTNTHKDWLEWVLSIYYKCNFVSKHCYYAFNLQWPDFALPDSFERYLISFHTEYLYLDWIVEQANLVYPKPVALISDYDIQNCDFFPDNITLIQIRSLHHQLELAKNSYGCNLEPNKPKYKLSSLAMRTTQYKRFVTAYLIQNFPQEQLILSYHKWLAKDNDLHETPDIEHLRSVNIDIPKTLININDESLIINNSPLANANWHISAFENALFNLTNESWHYSSTIKNNKKFQFPGPYFTDKTFKPLLAGRPFVPVGQSNSVKELETVGFCIDFGFDYNFDSDTGDLSRIKGVFNLIDQIDQKSIDQLYEDSLYSVIHNAKHIKNGELFRTCEDLNAIGYEQIKNWFT